MVYSVHVALQSDCNSHLFSRPLSTLVDTLSHCMYSRCFETTRSCLIAHPLSNEMGYLYIQWKPSKWIHEY